MCTGTFSSTGGYYTSPRGQHHQQYAFSRRRLQQPWGVHQPVPILLRGMMVKEVDPVVNTKNVLVSIKMLSNVCHLK